MLRGISERVHRLIGSLGRRGPLTRRKWADAIEALRAALLDSDVSPALVNSLVDAISSRLEEGVSAGQPISGSAVIDVSRDEITSRLGPTVNHQKFLTSGDPTVLAVCGPRGAGKTTTMGKIATWAKTRHGLDSLFVTLDERRTAAGEQMEIVAEQVGAQLYKRGRILSAVEGMGRSVTRAALANKCRLVIVDTPAIEAGDTKEAENVRNAMKQFTDAKVLWVMDASIGTPAVNSAREAAQILSPYGIILSKSDGASRGGVLLSIHHEIGVPVYWMGTGEKPENLEPFDAASMARRVLGLGDLGGLVRNMADVSAIHKLSQDKPVTKFRSTGLTYADMARQLQTLRKSGGVSKLLEHMPQASLNQMKASPFDDTGLGRLLALIESMTPKERQDPTLLDRQPSRRRRISNGAGLDLRDMNKLIKMQRDMTRAMRPSKLAAVMRSSQGRGLAEAMGMDAAGAQQALAKPPVRRKRKGKRK